MKIQYAVFFKDIDYSVSPHVYKHPVSLCTLSSTEKDMALGWPLYISFFGGTDGKHSFRVDVVRETGAIISLPDFYFNWPTGKIAHSEVFIVEFKVDSFGLYIFRLHVDGQILREFGVPIIQET